MRPKPSCASLYALHAGVGLYHLFVRPSSSPAIPHTTWMVVLRGSPHKPRQPIPRRIDGPPQAGGGHTPGVRVALGYKGAVEHLVATLVVVQVPSEVQVYAVLVHQRLNVGLQLVRTEDVAVIVVVCDTGTGTGTMVVRRRRYSLAWLVPHTHRSSSKSRTSAAVHRAVAIHDDPLLLQQPNAVSWCKDSHTRRRLKL